MRPVPFPCGQPAPFIQRYDAACPSRHAAPGCPVMRFDFRGAGRCDTSDICDIWDDALGGCRRSRGCRRGRGVDFTAPDQLGEFGLCIKPHRHCPARYAMPLSVPRRVSPCPRPVAPASHAFQGCPARPVPLDFHVTRSAPAAPHPAP